MAWTINDIRFGQDGVSSISWSAACNTSVVDWNKSNQLIIAAWLSSSDHTPGSHSVKLQWRNKTDNPSGSFAEFVTGSGELRAGTSAGVLSNTSAVGDGSGCQTKGDPPIDEEIENESPLQSGSFSPEKNEYIESQWCIDMSNAHDGDEYEFEIYDVTGDESLGVFTYTIMIAAGAQQYYQDCAGVFSANGDITKKATSKNDLAGSFDFSGNLATTLVFMQSCDGVFSATGDITKFQIGKILGGVLSGNGVITNLSIDKNVAGTFSASGSILKHIIPSNFGGDLNMSGSLSTTLILLKSIAGTLGNLTGSIATVLIPAGSGGSKTRKLLDFILKP